MNPLRIKLAKVALCGRCAKEMRFVNFAVASLVATTLATSLILYEDNETNSSKNIVEDVAWFYTKKNEIRTPLDRLVYNLAYYKAKARMSLRFSWLVKPFLGYV